MGGQPSSLAPLISAPPMAALDDLQQKLAKDALIEAVAEAEFRFQEQLLATQEETEKRQQLEKALQAESDDMRRELEDARRQNAEVLQHEAQKQAHYNEACQEFAEELSRERARLQRAADDDAALRASVVELAQKNVQLQSQVDSLEEAATASSRSSRHAQAALERTEAAAPSASPALAATSSDGVGDTLEVRTLRSELAERDRQLLEAATARRQCADQAERAAAALRTKLNELEAAIAYSPTTSSRGSSQDRCSNEDRGDGLEYISSKGVQDVCT